MRRSMSVFVLGLVCIWPALTHAQAPTAVVNGQVRDTSGAAIPKATVVVINDATNVRYATETNDEGIYSVPNLPPGTYRVQVSKQGFKTIAHPDIVLHVQDAEAIGFTLPVGPSSDTVTVEGGAPLVNTENAAVGTVIDRNFAESLPMNGRSFNTLLQLTPGVVIAPVARSGSTATGQFSIAGQRTDANNFTVDGVSANFGVGLGVGLGQSGTGGAQAFSALGGTSSLVSVDALQEFRIETSSFGPEFGKTPGGQVILTTRSGTNEFHGGVFDYFRNTVMDANDWFNNATIDLTTGKSIPRAPEHHNDFGGFLGGPIWKGKTFFFLSYEGARLELPQTNLIQVPSACARATGPTCPSGNQSASGAIAPYLNAYPQPNGPAPATPCASQTPGGCVQQFTGSFANKATLDAGSIRIDHTFSNRFSIFGRYNDAPSQTLNRVSSLSDLETRTVNTRTLTAGLNMVFGARLSNALRGNYSAQSSLISDSLDSFGGAVPLTPSLLLGSLGSDQNLALFDSFDTTPYSLGSGGRNRTKQMNFTDDLGILAGAHQLKFGGDYRGIFLNVDPIHNEPFYFIFGTQGFISTGMTNFFFTATDIPSQLLAQSLSLYAQDVWKAAPRLTLTYGLRWELSPAPSPRGNTSLAAWTNVNNSATAIAPPGTPVWETTYGNFAPRLGVAYTLTAKGDFVLRAGGGVFYDLGIGRSAALAYSFPHTFAIGRPNVSLPVADLTPYLPPITLTPPYQVVITAFSPNLKLPRSYEWNVAVEKSFGGKQAISATYVGQAGSELLRQQALLPPNSNFLRPFELTLNDARSNYNALQVQYRRPLSSALQALLNYTWSHSLDSVSDDVSFAIPNTISSAANDYASSNFDVRHSFSGALTYAIPSVAKSGPLRLVTGGWSLDTVIVARTGFPFNGLVSLPSATLGLANIATSRPDLVPGQPLYLYGAQCAQVFGPILQGGNGVLQAGQSCPGGKGLNPSAFSVPSAARQGTEGRNDIPGFGLTQVDLSIGRRFAISERLKLQFRADAFNVFNHPNFANPSLSPTLDRGSSGLLSSQMLNQGLGGGMSGLNSLFQQGGPRSLQLSLKMTF